MMNDLKTLSFTDLYVILVGQISYIYKESYKGAQRVENPLLFKPKNI